MTCTRPEHVANGCLDGGIDDAACKLNMCNNPSSDSERTYFCYDEADREHVENIIQTLEASFSIDCLFDVRDFRPNYDIDNMITAMKNCRNTVLVLSRSFCDKYCEGNKYKMHLCIDQITKMGELPITIILDECIIPDQISPWTSACFCLQDKHFWARFVSALKSDKRTVHQHKPEGYRNFQHVLSRQTCLQEPAKHPTLKLVSAPEVPVCNGFLSPNYPHCGSDHCIVIGIQGYGDESIFAHREASSVKKCEYSIRLHDVTSARLRQSDWTQTSLCPASPRSYRVWDGENSQTVSEIVDKNTDNQRAWMIRFFGQPSLFRLTFQLISVNKEVIDNLTVEIRTNGKRPSKRRTLGISRMPLINGHAEFEKMKFKNDVKNFYEILFSGNSHYRSRRFEFLLRRFREGSADIRILLLFLKVNSMAMEESDLDLVERIIGKAKRLLPKAKCRHLLAANITKTEGFVYRKYGQLIKAQERFELAYQKMLLEAPGFLSGLTLYHLTVNKYEILRRNKIPDRSDFEETLSNINKSIAMVELNSEMMSPQIQRLKIREAEIRAEQQRTSSIDTVNNIEQVLVIGNDDKKPFDYPQCCGLHCLASLYLGNGDFQKAEERALEALKIADDGGFHTEGKAINKTLRNIRLLRASDDDTLQINGYFADCEDNASSDGQSDAFSDVNSADNWDKPSGGINVAEDETELLGGGYHTDVGDSNLIDVYVVDEEDNTSRDGYMADVEDNT